MSGNCKGAKAPEGPINFPGTYERGSNWKMYNHLIGQIPDDIKVTDYCLGLHWSYIEAECGMGVAFTTRGGAKRQYKMDLRGMPLRNVAELSKSWCFEEATLGVAALNAWYAQQKQLQGQNITYGPPLHIEDAHDNTTLGTTGERGGNAPDAFHRMKPEIAAKENAKVVVVGHFPNVADVAKYAQLTVLERNCRDELDTPDPACEYVLPQADYAFITGVTFINKTAPRLLDLAKNAKTILVGPSVVMSPFLLGWGVAELDGSIVADPEKARFAVKNGAGKLFGEALAMASLKS